MASSWEQIEQFDRNPLAEDKDLRELAADIEEELHRDARSGFHDRDLAIVFARAKVRSVALDIECSGCLKEEECDIRHALDAVAGYTALWDHDDNPGPHDWDLTGGLLDALALAAWARFVYERHIDGPTVSRKQSFMWLRDTLGPRLATFVDLARDAYTSDTSLKAVASRLAKQPLLLVEGKVPNQTNGNDA